MRFLSAILTLLVPVAAVAGTPNDAVAACCADARRLAPEKATWTRYLDATLLPPEQQKLAGPVLAFHLNQLSREPDIVLPRLVAPNLYAIDLRDYGTDYKVYFELGNKDFCYHHQGVTAKLHGKTVTAAGEWLDGKAIAELVTLTESQTPIIPADWFVNQTAIQADRDGHGYYDFLGLGKDLADFQKLVGLNVKEAQRLKLEVAASVAKSSVTLNNRSMTRLQSLTGGYWATADFKTSVTKQNTIRLLDGDTEPPHGDAAEIYGTLPNGLFAYWLNNDKDKGGRQDSAPDFIASDGKAPGTDRRVHSALSCIRCHGSGLQPIDDWSRRVLQEPLRLQSPDYEKFKRLRQLYLSDLAGQIAEDNARFAKAVKRCNGLTPAENSKAFAAFWAGYAEKDWTAADIARRCGCTEEHLMAAIRANALATGTTDLVIAGLLATPPATLRTEMVEEAYATFQTILMGYRP